MNEENRLNRNKKEIQNILCVVLAAICLVILFYMNHTMNNMQQELSMLKQEVLQLDSSVSSQIGAISGNIETSLKKESSIVSDYSYQIQAAQINRKEKTVPIQVTVIPKEHKDGLKASFMVETDDGKTIIAPGEEGQAYTYSALISVPITHNLKLSVSFDDGTLQKSEVLENLFEPFESCFMKVDTIPAELSVSSSDHQLEYSGTIETTVTPSADGNNYPVSGNVLILKNGKAIKIFPIDFSEMNGSTKQSSETQAQNAAEYTTVGSGTYYTRFNEKINIKNNALIELETVIKDNFGFEYKQTIDSQQIDKDGNVNPVNISRELIVE